MAHIAAGFVTVYCNGEKHRKRLLKSACGHSIFKVFHPQYIVGEMCNGLMFDFYPGLPLL